MFVVTEAQAAAIRTLYEQRGEFSGGQSSEFDFELHAQGRVAQHGW
jgi:hypothetical protein